MQTDEAELLIKTDRLFVYGVHNHSVNSDLIGHCQRALNGVSQQHLADAVFAGGKADRQPADQSGRYWMAGKLAGRFGGQMAKRHG
jgi:hypothetical protein